MEIIFPSNTKETIDNIRTAIGRNVEFFVKYKDECPVCGVNPVTGGALNAFCLTCSGEGYVITYSGTQVLAHITWNPSEQLQWVTGGQFSDYDCRIQIERSAINLNLVDTVDHIVVDNKTLSIEKMTPRGVKELNRILLDLKEK